MSSVTCTTDRPAGVLWMAGAAFEVTPLPDLPLFRSPVRMTKLTGDRAIYHAALTVAGPICSCGATGHCAHIGVLRWLGYLPPAKGLRNEVAYLFFGEDH